MLPEPSELIGFPIPLLGNRPVRLPVVWRSQEEGLLAVQKPANVASLPDNWYDRLPVLAHALNHQIEREKPELQRLGLVEPLLAVNIIDPELWGPVIFAEDRERMERLRNALGSGMWTFTFRFVAGGGGNSEHLQCSLPIARHRTEARMLVSQTSGKQSLTVFRRLAPAGKLAEWEATIAYPRLHQLFVHARESGLSICGDLRYGSMAVPTLADLKRTYRPSRRFEEAPPLFPGPMAYVSSIQFGESPDRMWAVSCPPPPKWMSALRQLRLYEH